MKKVCLIAMLGFFTSRGSAQLGSLRPIMGARMDGAVPAQGPVGSAVLPARELLIEGAYPDGTPLRGNLFIVFDPSSGYYIWTCHSYGAPAEHRRTPGRLPEHRLFILNQRNRFPGEAAVYVDRNQMVAFEAVVHSMLIQESTRTASHMDDAEAKALQSAMAQLGILQHDTTFGSKRISLLEKLGNAFFTPKDSPLPGGFLVKSVSRKELKWEVEIEGQWRERLTLDDSGQVMSHYRIE